MMLHLSKRRMTFVYGPVFRALWFWSSAHRLPSGRQIVLHHLQRQAQQARLDRAATRAETSRQSFLRDLLDIEEAAARLPGEWRQNYPYREVTGQHRFDC